MRVVRVLLMGLMLGCGGDDDEVEMPDSSNEPGPPGSWSGSYELRWDCAARCGYNMPLAYYTSVEIQEVADEMLLVTWNRDGSDSRETTGALEKPCFRPDNVATGDDEAFIELCQEGQGISGSVVSESPFHPRSEWRLTGERQ